MTEPNAAGGNPPAIGSGGGYGAYTPMPPEQAPYGTPQAPAGPPPAPVRNAVILMYVSVAISVIGMITALASKSSIRSLIADNNPGYDPARLDAAVNQIVLRSVIGAIIGIIIYLWLALKLRQARNWARIVVWVFAGLGLLVGLASFAAANTSVLRVFGIIGLLIDIALIVLLLQPASNEYFRRR